MIYDRDGNEISYNEKGFLLPDSINSMAAYHAKIHPDGGYRFRVHDCLTGVRLIGNLNSKEDIKEAVEKLKCLADAAGKFAEFIETNYSQET